MSFFFHGRRRRKIYTHTGIVKKRLLNSWKGRGDPFRGRTSFPDEGAVEAPAENLCEIIPPCYKSKMQVNQSVPGQEKGCVEFNAEPFPENGLEWVRPPGFYCFRVRNQN